MTPSTETLYTARLTARQARQKFDPTEIRLSEVGHCLRRASLRILGYDSMPTTLRQESVFLSGDEHEEAIASLWEEAYPGEIDRQVEVQSPYGTGHMDVWVKSLRHYVECKSTTKKSVPYLPHEDYVDQVTLYHHYYIQPTGGGTAELAYRVKETGEIISIPVPYDPERAKRLIARLEDLQGAVAFGQPLPIPKGSSMDQFPCGYRDQAQEWVPCPFWHHCWDATANDTENPEIAKLVGRYRELTAELTTRQEAVSTVKDELEDLQAALAFHMKTMGTNTVSADGFEVRRTYRRGWTYYDARQAIAQGAVDEQVLQPFEKERNGSVQWSVRDLSELRAKKKGA